MIDIQSGIMGISIVSVLPSLINSVLGVVYSKKNQRLNKNQLIEAIKDKSEVINAEVTKIEALNKNFFMSGWRPLIGWICGINLAYNLIIKDVINYIMVLCNDTLPQLPYNQFNETKELIYVLLGLGAFRTIEKIKGVTR